MVVLSTDIHQRSHNQRHLDPGKGLKLGIFGFSLTQNNCGLSDTYVTCMNCSLSVKTNMVKCRMDNKMNAFVLLLLLCVWLAKNLQNPNIEPHDWQHNYTGWYWRSEISCIYLSSWFRNRSVGIILMNYVPAKIKFKLSTGKSVPFEWLHI